MTLSREGITVAYNYLETKKEANNSRSVNVVELIQKAKFKEKKEKSVITFINKILRWLNGTPPVKKKKKVTTPNKNNWPGITIKKTPKKKVKKKKK